MRPADRHGGDVVDLSQIPRDRLLAAAGLPENAHARKALLKAAGQPGSHPTTPEPEKARQSASVCGGDTVCVVLPLPPKELHPNARVHWAKKAKAAREYRRKAYFAAFEVLGGRVGDAGLKWQRATVQITWYAPSRRRTDPDNALASLKPALDGLSRPHGKSPGAMIVADDSGFSFLPVRMEVDRENPRVVIEVAYSP